MSCGINLKFDKAVDAVKEAFKAAVDAKDFDRSTLSEVWRHYQGLQTILEGLPEHKDHEESTFNISLPDGCYDPDYNINLFNNDPLSGNIEFNNNFAAAPVTFGGAAGEDMINFTTSGGEVVTVPEHEDDEKIVL
tara:strand:- start:125 stop:529 length:405 start_codon:yes stop_codon:yes gene_type:complete